MLSEGVLLEGIFRILAISYGTIAAIASLVKG